MMTNYIKSTVKDLPKKKVNLDTKDKPTAIAEWLRDWLISRQKNGKISDNHLLPLKKDIADYLGTSIGTVQTAVLKLQDDGLVIGMQRIGSIVCPLYVDIDIDVNKNRYLKLSSKRDSAISVLKKYIINSNMQVGDSLPSARDLATLIGGGASNVRLALNYLTKQGIVVSKGGSSKTGGWKLAVLPVLNEDTDCSMVVRSESMVAKLTPLVEAFLLGNYKQGERIPSFNDLATIFNVSIKTISDAIVLLQQKGFLYSKRGRHGTFLSNGSYQPATDFYHYEKALEKLKALFANDLNTKSPVKTKELSDLIGFHYMTVRRALLHLKKEGLISFVRGVKGGVVVNNKELIC